LEAFQKYRHLQRVQQGRGDVRLGRRLQVRIPYSFVGLTQVH
jgi:hypothetical protein